MTRFTLAAAVAAGVLCSASTADAQYRYGGSYAAPNYSYSAPSYYGGFGNAPYAANVPAYNPFNNQLAPTVYPNGYYFNQAAWAPNANTGYRGNVGNFGVYNGPYNSGNLFISPYTRGYGYGYNPGMYRR